MAKSLHQINIKEKKCKEIKRKQTKNNKPKSVSNTITKKKVMKNLVARHRKLASKRPLSDMARTIKNREI